MRSRDEACRILESALSVASSGVDDAEVSLRGGHIGISQFTRNQLHPSSELAHEQLVIRLQARGRAIVCATTDISVDGAQDCVQQARAELERLAPGKKPEALPPPQSYTPVEAYDEPVAHLQAMERTAMAARVLSAALRSTHRGVAAESYRSTGGVYASGHILVGRGGVGARGELLTYAVANSRGLVAYHPSTLLDVQIEMESDGRTAVASASSYQLADIHLSETIDRALNNVLSGTRMGVLPPGIYRAVLDADAVSSLVQIIGAQAGLQALMENRSFLTHGQGQKLVDDRISIFDDYHHPAHNAKPFDCEGVMRRSVKIIDRGVGHNPVVAWASAQRWNRTPTGHARLGAGLAYEESADHLVMTGGDGDVSTLLENTQAGVLINGFTDLQVVDSKSLRVVGSTAHGTFAVENGVLTTPLVDMRFDISLLDVLSQVAELGAPRWASGAVVPPIRVDAFPLYATT